MVISTYLVRPNLPHRTKRDLRLHFVTGFNMPCRIVSKDGYARYCFEAITLIRLSKSITNISNYFKVPV